MLRGNCATTAPAVTVIPERLRNVRRSIVRPSIVETGRVKRLCATAAPVDLRVNMASSSDLGSAIVVADVLAQLIALAGPGAGVLCGRRTDFFFSDDGCRGCCSARRR